MKFFSAQRGLKRRKTINGISCLAVLITIRIPSWSWKFYKLYHIITGIGWLRQSQGPFLLWSTSGDRTSAMTGNWPDWNAASLLTCIVGCINLVFSVVLPEWLVSQLEEPLFPESLLPSLPPLESAQLSFFKCTGNGFLKGLEGWGRTAEIDN